MKPALFLSVDRHGNDRFGFTCADGAVAYSGLTEAECRRAVVGLCDPDEAARLLADLDGCAVAAPAREAPA